MSAATLYNELFIEIFRHLDIKSLSKISLCCHRFYGLVQPILYSTYVQPPDDKPDVFIRTIFEKPHLAEYVKHYVGQGGYRVTASLPETCHHSVRQELLPKYFDRSSVTSIADWYDDAVLDSGWDAVSAILLLRFASSLESITMLSYGDSEEENGPFNFHIDAVLQKMKTLQINANSTLPCMAKLRRVHIASDEPWVEVQIALVSHYLRLKSVSEVIVEQLGNEYGADYDLFKALPRHHHITDLTLQRCNIDENAFRYFISSFPSLKRFHFEHIPRYGTEALMIGDTLAHLKDSLEELAINTPKHSQEPDQYINLNSEEGSQDGDDPYDVLPSMIGSLAQFHRLKKVEIAVDILVREGTCWDKPHHVKAFLESLPPFLEHLVILNCITRSVEVGVPLLSASLPHLKSLKMTLCPSFKRERSWGLVTVESLGRMALKKGVDFACEVLEDEAFGI